MREVGPESAGGAASRAPPPLPPPPPLCRAPTLSRLSPGAGARGGAGGGVQEMGRRARAKQPAPAGAWGEGRGRKGVRALGGGGSPRHLWPRACAFCAFFDSALSIRRVLIGTLLRWSRPIFFQSRNQIFLLLVGSSGCADTVVY